MYRARSQRRFEKGDAVLSLYHPLGEGIVTWIGVQECTYKFHHEDNSTEDILEYFPCAIVEFEGKRKFTFSLSNLILSEQVQNYESLEPGDLIVFGKVKKGRGIVISNLPRRKIKNGITVTDRSIHVLVDGAKHRLPLRQKILMIQKARDCLHY